MLVLEATREDRFQPLMERSRSFNLIDLEVFARGGPPTCSTFAMWPADSQPQSGNADESQLPWSTESKYPAAPHPTTCKECAITSNILYAAAIIVYKITFTPYRTKN